MRTSTRRQQFGITLVDAVVVLGILGVMLGTGLPALDKARQSQQLESSAAQLRTDVQLARSTAVALGQPVRMVTKKDASGSCYVIHAGAAGACTCTSTTTAQCNGEGWIVRAAHFTAPVALSSGSPTMTFDGTQGTVTPTGTLSLTNQVGQQLKVIVNVMGRARSCRVGQLVVGQEAC